MSQTRSFRSRSQILFKVFCEKSCGLDNAEYAYDALGRRIHKEVFNSGKLDTKAPGDFFYYDGHRTIEHHVGNGATTKFHRSFLFGLEYIDELVAIYDDVKPAGAPHRFVLQDQNYNVIATTDASGDMMQQYARAPYGKLYAAEDAVGESIDFEASPENLDLAFGHQGLWHDHETGLVYNRARQYQPEPGEFMDRSELTMPSSGEERPEASESELSIENLVRLSDEELAELDIAAINLACAKGLPGSGAINIPAVLETLDAWVERVRAETRKYFPVFQRNPESYDNSVAQYRMIMLITVLMQDLGIRYNPDRINDVDFKQPGDLFLSGLLGGDGGTCVSMPVLYVAIGRGLGYPLRLVEGPEHLFLRWEDPRDRRALQRRGHQPGLSLQAG